MLRKVGVIGAGVMGTGLAQMLAEHGMDVIIIDKEQSNLDNSKENLIQVLNKSIEKWGITESEKKVMLSKVQYTTDKQALMEADFVIEAIDEILEEKKAIFEEIDQICRPEVIFATNSSTLSITELASVTKRPDKFIGLNFTYPVAKRVLVQVVRGLKTSDSTYEIAKDFIESMGKKSIQIFESPGHVTVRLMMPLINDAINIVMEGVASEEDVDTAMKLGYDFTYGPLEMADRMGLDAVLRVSEAMYKEYGDVRFRPALTLKKLVRAGHLGEKTGQGFFKYENGERV